MAFFKTKQEKEIEAQMQRDEQMEVFNEQLNSIKAKRDEYAKIAAEAELNGDNGSYDVAVNALIELNDIISSLIQAKANFDLINVSNSITISMATALNALDKMASSNNVKMPDIRKIQKFNVKMSKYMRNIKIGQKAMGGALKRSNPANHTRSEEELEAVKPMIDAARSKLSGTSMPKSKAAASGIDLSEEIAAEKNRKI